jgi:hypothetical protein
MAGRVRKDTKPGLGKTSKLEGRASGAMTCPPPSATRRPSRSFGRPSGTLRRFSSSPRAVDAEDLAVVVRVTAKTKPRVARGDPAKAPLEPREAFLLSRVDGELTVEDLADLLGLSASEALTMVRKLVTLSLLEI